MDLKRGMLTSGVILAAAMSLLLWFRGTGHRENSSRGPQQSAVSPAKSSTNVKATPSKNDEPTSAERILANYGMPSQTPEDDLRDVARMLSNFSLLVKGENPLPLGSNEEIAAALRGKNKADLKAFNGDHRTFDSRGRIVDRWGTPIFFHAESRDRMDIRSAGPDRTMWTADDVHRLHNGRFLNGDALLAPSLFSSESQKRSP